VLHPNAELTNDPIGYGGIFNLVAFSARLWRNLGYGDELHELHELHELRGCSARGRLKGDAAADRKNADRSPAGQFASCTRWQGR